MTRYNFKKSVFLYSLSINNIIWYLYLPPKHGGVSAILRTPRQEVSVEGATQAQIDLSVEEPVGHMWVSINI